MTKLLHKIICIVWKTKLSANPRKMLWSEPDCTECCGIGPITVENHCPKCGRRIER
jgi:hypothetical protein